MAVGRDAWPPGLPARAAALLPVAARHRGARLGIPHTLRVLHAAALSAAWCAAGPRTRRDVMIAPPFTRAHYPGGAMGTSRPTSITHAWATRALPTRRAPRHHTRNIRTRITPPVRPIRPPRAAWHPAHAESFACRGSVRYTVRGRAAHPARCHDRAAITRAGGTRITHTIFARASPAVAHRRPRWLTAPAARWGHRALPPLPTRRAHPAPKNLCASIHPAQTLFVFLCVQNFRTTALAPPGIVSRGRAPPSRTLARAPWCGPVTRPLVPHRPRTARHTKKAASQLECRFRIGKPSRFSRVRHFA